MSQPESEHVDFDAVCKRVLAKTTPASEEEVRRRVEAEAKQRHTSQVIDLRYNWNAPRRHVATNPKHEGQWAAKLDSLSAKLGTGLFAAIVGRRGAGKTQLAVELMKIATERLMSAKFLTSTSLFMRLKATFTNDRDKETELDIIRELSKFKLLVVDEAGKRGQSDWENNVLFELLNRRYNNMVDTILLDNNEPEAFCASIGPSLASRLNETGGIIHATWPSFRD